MTDGVEGRYYADSGHILPIQARQHRTDHIILRAAVLVHRQQEIISRANSLPGSDIQCHGNTNIFALRQIPNFAQFEKLISYILVRFFAIVHHVQNIHILKVRHDIADNISIWIIENNSTGDFVFFLHNWIYLRHFEPYNLSEGNGLLSRYFALLDRNSELSGVLSYGSFLPIAMICIGSNASIEQTSRPR